MLTIDIHYGKPTVDTALSNLDSQLRIFKKQGHKSICVITGYGSTTGKHKIKTAAIDYLEELKGKHQIKDFILGENINIFNSKYQNFLYKELLDDEIKQRTNPGFVIVIL